MKTKTYNIIDKINILSILQSTSIDKPMSLTKLSGLAHTDSRVVKEIIRQLRMEGEAIGGSLDLGYFLARSISDLDGIIISIKSSISTRLQTIKALETTRLRMTKDGQMDTVFDKGYYDNI